MDYEKAYKDALAKAREIHRNEDKKRSDMEWLFPELKNKDEEIRKALIKGVESCKASGWTNFGNNVDIDVVLAWLEKQGQTFTKKDVDDAYLKGIIDAKNELEKQGKQKTAVTDFNAEDWYVSKVDGKIHDMTYNPADKVEPKFKVGDWIYHEISGNAFHINRIENRTYISDEGATISFGRQNDWRLWTISDAKDGDVLCYKDEISLYRHDIKNCTKQETTFGGFVYYCCYDGKRLVVDSLYSLTEQDKMDIHPATKEQHETLFKVMADAGYTFDFDKKELKKIEDEPENFKQQVMSEMADLVKYYIQQKPTEWSEEDEEIHRRCICAMRASACGSNH